MEQQMIIVISREFGSGGREIASKVAEDYGLPFYDRNMLDEFLQDSNLDSSELEKYDEKPRNKLLTRRVRGYSTAFEDNLAESQFEYMRKQAEAGESFVVLGRCAETVLNDYEGMISIFVLGDLECKVRRVKERYNISEASALLKINRHDKKRKLYHNTYSTVKWGDSRGYDLCINSSRLGVDGSVAMIEKYIEMRTSVAPSKNR